MRKQVSLYMVAAILAFVIAGYLPALIADFVPQDQWRAFSYGLDVDGADKWGPCVQNRFSYFIHSGRPLVWLPECVEHRLVHGLPDYKFLRIPALAVLLSTMLLCGFVFRNVVGEYWQGVFLAAPLVLAPGYAMMFYQGDTAGGVLASVAFSLASAYFAAIALRDGIPPRSRDRILPVIWCGAFFVLALLNFPAFAFLAFGAVFLAFMHARDVALALRLRAIAAVFIFYGALCIMYFAAAKSALYFLPYRDMGLHQFELADQTSVLAKAWTIAAAFFESRRIANANFIPYAGIVAMTASALFVPVVPRVRCFVARYAPGFAYVLLFPLIAVFGSAPAILSVFQEVPTRIVLPADFMVGFAAAFLVIKLGEKLADRLRVAAAVPLVCLLALAVLAVQQFRITQSLVQDSEFEVRAIRNAVDSLVREGNWQSGRHVHVIRPAPASFSRKTLWFGSVEFAPATTQHLTHIGQMFTMALRERLDAGELRAISIRDCRLDFECGMAPPRPYEIVLTQARDGAASTQWPGSYKIVDLSRLNWNGQWN